MIRWLQKQDGTRVLQEHFSGTVWGDVPTEVEKPEPRKPREFIMELPKGIEPARVWNSDQMFMQYTGKDIPNPMGLIKVREVIE